MLHDLCAIACALACAECVEHCLLLRVFGTNACTNQSLLPYRCHGSLSTCVCVFLTLRPYVSHACISLTPAPLLAAMLTASADRAPALANTPTASDTHPASISTAAALRTLVRLAAADPLSISSACTAIDTHRWLVHIPTMHRS